MKRLGLVQGALVCALVAGGGFLSVPPMAVADDSDAKSGASPNDPVYIDLAPLVLPIIDGGNINQVVQITVTIECSDEASADKVRNARPRLADAFIQDLYGEIEHKRLLNGAVVDVTRLRDEMKRVTAEVLGESSVRNILIQRIAQRTL